MTQPRRPDDPPHDEDETLPERDEPATSGTDPSGDRLSTTVTSDELPYVDDRVSKVFVGAVAAVFAGIFAYALLFGGAGLLTPEATERPSREPSPSASPATSPSGTPVVSPTASPSAGGSPSGSPAGSPSADPSPSPSPSPSPAVSPDASPTIDPESGSPSPAGS